MLWVLIRRTSVIPQHMFFMTNKKNINKNSALSGAVLDSPLKIQEFCNIGHFLQFYYFDSKALILKDFCGVLNSYSTS